MTYKQRKQYRLPGHTYAETGSYFITICEQDRREVFGNVLRIEGKAAVALSELGAALAGEISVLESKWPNLTLGRWQIMPDHLHIVLHLDEALIGKKDENAADTNAPRRVPTCPTGIQPLNPGSVSSISNHLKGDITKAARRMNMGFCWQARFYDRIIRDGKELCNIETYILNNPESWLRNRNL